MSMYQECSICHRIECICGDNTLDDDFEPTGSGRGFGTYEDLGNGYTKEGNVAGDYAEAGRDPELRRQTPKEIAERIQRAISRDEI